MKIILYWYNLFHREKKRTEKYQKQDKIQKCITKQQKRICKKNIIIMIMKTEFFSFVVLHKIAEDSGIIHNFLETSHLNS